MPGDGHVFDPLLAGIINQRKGQSVFVRSAELIDAGALAAFRSLTACFLQCNRVGRDGIGAPDVALGINDIERAIGLYRPDSVERIGPCAGQRDWTRLGRGRAGTDERYQGTRESNSERGLYFHIANPVL